MRKGVANPSTVDQVQIRDENSAVDKSSHEARGVVGSNPSPRTKIFTATYAPPHMTHTMCQGLGIGLHHKVLEPSAGSGGMVRVISEYTQDITAVELSGDLFDEMRVAIPYPVQAHRGDFLRMSPDKLGKFDRIIMCPPKNSVAHIEHAIKFLEHGGKLLALVQDQNIKDIGDRPWSVFPVPDKFEYSGEPIDVSYVLYSELV